MTDPAPPMVELRSITKHFGDFTAVDDITLEVKTGEFITFLGPSGCGKTTLLRMISGFETPTLGAVLLDGREVTHEPPYRRDVNQVFQSYALFPHLTVRENIAFGLKMKKLPRAEVSDRVARVMALVALEGLESRKPAALSGGQKQRVALARALICQPKVLLLDEPLSALDAKLRHQMQIELKRLQRTLGITFIFVTHDQEEALTMSDRIAVFHRGKLEQLAPVDKIYHQPRTTFVANFIGEANILTAILQGDGQTLLLNDQLQIPLPDSAKAAVGERLTISIRPEKIHISKERQPEAAIVFAATIEEEIFKGVIDRLTLRTTTGLELTAIVANESAHQECFRKGDRVWCCLHPSDIVVVQDR